MSIYGYGGLNSFGGFNGYGFKKKPVASEPQNDDKKTEPIPPESKPEKVPDADGDGPICAWERLLYKNVNETIKRDQFSG